ncbi:MAG: sporulation integral membrane protein YtvI [Clostridiales bacterium]|nr:sporulation integral membrane protein YtvI [Clostridiales bacterium]
MLDNRIRKVLLRTLYILLLCAAVYVVFKYAIPILMPFLLALCIGLLVRPIARFCKRRLKIPQKLAAVLLVTIFLAGIAALCLWVGTQAFDFAWDLGNTHKDKVIEFIRDLGGNIKKAVAEWNPDAVAFVDPVMDSLQDSVSSVLSGIVNGILGMATRLPMVLLQILFFIIASYFFALDFDALRNMLAAALTAERYEKLQVFKTAFSKTIGRYVRSYSFILLMTFAELLVGFLIIGVENFALLAMAIALFDILPVVGSGTILLPWAAIALIQGDTMRGINLIVMYLIITVIRQFVEPRVIGKQVGLHPILTLVSIYVGMRLFGGIGLFGLPVLLAVFFALEREGVIHFFPRRELMESDAAPKKKPIFRKKK